MTEWVRHGPVCGKCLIVSATNKTDKGFYAVCTRCNISTHGTTADEAEDKFAGKACKFIEKHRRNQK